MDGYKLVFDFGHSCGCLNLKSLYLSPKNSDSKTYKSEKLKANGIFEILIIEVFKLINFGGQNCFIIVFIEVQILSYQSKI